jgi:hypothetical protein
MSTRPVITARSGRLSSTFGLVFAALLVGCGGGGGSGDSPTAAVSTSVANTLAITLDRGTDGAAINAPFVTVTVCVPGTSDCRTVDHVLVDTGSFGLRLAASSVLNSGLQLPAVTNAAGVQVGECGHFASGFVWGSVRRADVKLAGETAANLPIQVVGDPATLFAAVPRGCSNTGANFGADLGANGILGVGVFNEDCPTCANSTAPAVYFACAAIGCSSTTLPLASQVANPVRAFSADNNGVVVVLPEVPPGGAETLSGSLIFGIGTQSNNQLGTATVFTTDNRGEFTTFYKGTTFASSFLDSGSNGIFFDDPAIPACFGFYCPPDPLALSAINRSSTGVSSTVNFTIESIQSINSRTVAANLGGDINLPGAFDWGLPFFFGRKVFVGISGASTPGGTGPFWAY